MKKLNIEKGKNIHKIFTIVAFVICIMSLSLNVQAAKNKFIRKSGKVYYYNSKGKKVRGLKKIKGKYYYFDKKGVRYQKGWKTIRGRRYYFSKKNGAAYTGIKKVGSKRYLFSNTGKRYKTGLVSYHKKIYYTKNGVVQRGWKTISRKRYYFTSTGMAKTGWFTYKKKQYYFDKKGVMQKNKWVGNKYLGSNGYVTKTKENTNPTPKPKPEPSTEPESNSNTENTPNPTPQPKPGATGYYYNESISNQIFNDINQFRISNGKKAAKKATNTLLKYSIIRASHSISNNLKTGDINDLPTHGLGQIGLGHNANPYLLIGQDTSTGNLNAIDVWANSPIHRSNILYDYDQMAVAVVYTTSHYYTTNGKTQLTRYHVSVIVTFGTIQTDTYSVNGVNMGAYDRDKAPLYNYTIHRSYGDTYISKEYITDTYLEVPYEKWDTYLNYTTVK